MELIVDVTHTRVGCKRNARPLCACRPPPPSPNSGSDGAVITGHLVRVKERINPQPLGLIKFNCTTSRLLVINGRRTQRAHLSAALGRLRDDARR